MFRIPFAIIGLKVIDVLKVGCKTARMFITAAGSYQINRETLQEADMVGLVISWTLKHRADPVVYDVTSDLSVALQQPLTLDIT